MQIIGKKIISLKNIDSTSDEARRLIKQAVEEGTVIVAQTQSKGRGKPGFGWFSPLGGIYLSVIVRPLKNPQELTPITQLGARGVVSLLKQTADLHAQIKLPNDVLVNNKKICGILVERLASGHLIIGLGLNVNIQAGSFPDDIKTSTTSLAVETGRQYSVEQLTRELLQLLDQEYLAYLKGIC